MSELYDFSKNAWHVKFFIWMWEVDPTIRFKTMCPYFWQYIGSIIILPFIVLVKLLKMLLTPVFNFIDKLMESRKEKLISELMAEIENAETDEDYYNIYQSRCWKKYGYQIKFYKDRPDEFLKKRSDVDAIGGYYYKPTPPKNNKFQEIQDKITYGWIGKILGSIIILGLVYLVGWGGYEFVHLFTMNQFLNFMLVFGIIITVSASFIGTLFMIFTVYEKYFCDSWLHKVVFWKPIGNFFLMIFRSIGNIIQITFDMIGNFYKNQCPTIHWKNEK